jgi:hypothetical protein
VSAALDRDAAIDAAVASGAFWQDGYDADMAPQWDPREQRPWDEYACGELDCPTCNPDGWADYCVCDDAPDTGFYGFWATTTHGVSGTHAIVTRSIAQDRSMGPVAATIAKREAHSRSRVALRSWLAAQDYDQPEPIGRLATSWDVW